jgi:peptide/nickel transport system substrate-binding protein
MTIIKNTFPAEIGFQPDFGSNEGSLATLYAEPLAEFNMNTEEFFPMLATSWEQDFANKTLTVHLRKGVKFHDGTDFNAEAVIWNYELMAEAHKAPYQDETDSIDIIDDYTLRFVMNDYPYDTASSLLNNVDYFSPTAYQTHGKDWCYEHAVATGAFVVTDCRPSAIMGQI